MNGLMQVVGMDHPFNRRKLHIMYQRRCGQTTIFTINCIVSFTLLGIGNDFQYENKKGKIMPFCVAINLPVSQRSPVYPGTQLQVYPLTWSVQDPPFKQGSLKHSSISLRIQSCVILIFTCNKSIYWVKRNWILNIQESRHS